LRKTENLLEILQNKKFIQYFLIQFLLWMALITWYIPGYSASLKTSLRSDKKQSVDVKKLEKLFWDEDYEEIIGLLRNKELKKLSYKEAFYLGYAYLMLGEQEKALSCLKQAFSKAKTLKERAQAGEIMSQIYFYRKDYRDVIKTLGVVNLRELSDRAKYYYAMALINLEMFSLGKTVAYFIKDGKLREKVLKVYKMRYGTRFFGQVFQVYDSNIRLVEQENITGKSGFVTQTMLMLNSYAPRWNTQVLFFGSYQNNRENKAYDIYMGSFEYKKKGKILQLTFPSLSLVYANNDFYTTTGKVGIELKFVKDGSIKGEVGGEYNFQNKDKHALFYGLKARYKIFSLQWKEKNYWHDNGINIVDRANIRGGFNWNKKLGKGFSFTISGSVQYTIYKDIEDRPLRPGGDFSLDWKFFKAGGISFKASVEKNILLKKDKEHSLEQEYFKYVVGLGVKINF